MFYLIKVISQLILPPGVFLILGAGLFFLQKKYKNSRIILMGQFLFFLLFYLLSIRPVSSGLIRLLENRYDQPEFSSRDFDYIVVLGGGQIIRESGSNLSPDATVRLMEGLSLYKETQRPIIFCGGRVLLKEKWPSESETAYKQFIRAGVKEEAVLIEDDSRNTYENAANLIERYNPESILLVTSAYHMPRALLSFTPYETEIIPYPVDFKAEDREYILLDFLPSIHFLQASYNALHELLGLAFYRIRYL